MQEEELLSGIFTVWDHDRTCPQQLAEGHVTKTDIFNFGSYADIPTILLTFEMLLPQSFL